MLIIYHHLKFYFFIVIFRAQIHQERCILQYDDLPNELFSQFISKGDSITNYEKKEYAKIGYSKDVDFENKINNIISSFKADYDNFKEEYKIDWNKKYIFITNYDYFRTYPIIYFEESKKAFYIVSKL